MPVQNAISLYKTSLGYCVEVGGRSVEHNIDLISNQNGYL